MKTKVMSAFVGRDKGEVPSVINCAMDNGVQVLCIQEVMNFELDLLQKRYRFVRYVPMTRFGNGTTMGLVTCTSLPVMGVQEHYYSGNATILPNFDESTPERINATKRRPLLVLSIDGGDACFRVGNTHFLYSKDGTPQDAHYTALRSLMFAAEDAGSMLLCGAMVMPRDGALYKELTESPLFLDLLPRTIRCTLDLDLHKLSELLKSGAVPEVVVDYIFGIGFNPGYLPEEVRQFHGVCAHTPLLVTF